MVPQDGLSLSGNHGIHKVPLEMSCKARRAFSRPVFLNKHLQYNVLRVFSWSLIVFPGGGGND